MTSGVLPLIAVSMIAVAAFWCLPRKYAQDGFAATTAFGLFLLFPFSAIWLVGSVFVVQQAIVLGNKTGRRGLVTGLAIVALGAAFLASRESEELFGASWAIVGIAYFTLRHIHVLIECYLERINAPTIRQYARYHLLMPVLFAGPIHRLPHFERQCERRRWSAEEFFSGAERALFGFALAVIGGEFLGGAARELLGVSVNSGLGTLWIASMIDWVRLYAQFAGLTSIALGLCLMIGLRLEENFNQPWRARNLVDFWSRWHMTLSFWCRDYVYFPVAASLRSPVAGVFCAMLVLGLWHESSWNYLFWAVYQAIGIVVSQIYLAVRDRLGVPKFPELVSAVVAPLAVLGWLASAKPVIARLVEALGL